MSAVPFLKMSAELSAAHNFHDERERERERHFLMSDSYSDSGSKFCTLGNFKNTGTSTPLELDLDELPLSTFKVRKSSPAIIGNSFIEINITLLKMNFYNRHDFV